MFSIIYVVRLVRDSGFLELSGIISCFVGSLASYELLAIARAGIIVTVISHVSRPLVLAEVRLSTLLGR